jgi:CTP:molybdopterin cytidylyltransferase MocA
MTVAAVVLAAGEASRYGSPKQRILLPRVLERLRETSVDEIVVVEGAHALEVPDDAQLVACPDWVRGPGASLRCGLSRLRPEVAAVVVVLADGPRLAPGAVDRVLEEWRRSGNVVAASYNGARGHPLVLGRGVWDRVPDEGLRAMPVTLVPCDDLGAPGDVDTEEDLRRL